LQPKHGHGSGEKELGKMFKEEQDLLKDRKLHYRKDQLKKKYSAQGTTSSSTTKQGTSPSWLETMISRPFHAHGSGETKFDDMYKAQQQVLYERREYYGNKDMLRKKYSHLDQDHLRDISSIKDDPKLKNQREDDAMYIDEKGFEFPSLTKLFNPKLKP
jgi:hypothetical protein